MKSSAERSLMPKETDRHEPEIPFADVAALAKEVMLRDGRHVPTLIVQGRAERLILQLPDLPSLPEAKHQLMFLAGVYVAQEFALGPLRQVFFISEAWLSLARNGQPLDVRPSEDLERKEVLVIAALYPQTGQQELVLQEIIRHGQDQPVSLAAVRLEDADIRPDSPLLRAFVEGHQAGDQSSLR